MKKRKVPEDQLTGDEKERRRVQRELRDIAVGLQKVGQQYKPQKYKRKMFVTGGAGKARREKKKVKTANKTAVRVVVLPIFWEERAEEMQAVLDAAKKVEGLLACLGVRVVTDNNNNFKPGPRMKHWETLGVPVRVEIGPQDVAKGSCVVARSVGEAGTVAERTTVKMSQVLVKHVRQVLKDAGIETEVKAAATGVVPSTATQHEGAVEEEVSGDEEDESEEYVLPAPVAKTAKSKKAPVAAAGGDDMDDFDLNVAAEEVNLNMTKKDLAKKKRKDDKLKKKMVTQKAVLGETAEEEQEADLAEAPQKKSKTGVFK